MSALLEFYFRFYRIGMLFCTKLPNYIKIEKSWAELWCYIGFQDGGRYGAILLPATYWMMSVSSECQSLSANLTSSEYFHPRLRYKYSSVEKQTSAILGSYFRFRPYHRNWHVVLRQAAKFHQNRTTHVGNMTSYRFSRWRPSAMFSLLGHNGGPAT